MNRRSHAGQDVQRMVADVHPALPRRHPLTPLRTTLPDDDPTERALRRYAAATEVRPAPDLVARITRRVAAEAPPEAPIRILRAVRAGDVRGARRALRWALARDVGRTAPAAPRFKALTAVVAGFVLIGGGAAAGLVGVELLTPAVTEDGSLSPGSPDLVHGVILPPSLAPVGPSAGPAAMSGDSGTGQDGPGSLTLDEGMTAPFEEDPIEPDQPSEPDVTDPATEPKRGNRGGGGRENPAHPGGGPREEPKQPKQPPKGPRNEPETPRNEPKPPRTEPDPPRNEPNPPRNEPQAPRNESKAPKNQASEQADEAEDPEPRQARVGKGKGRSD